MRVPGGSVAATAFEEASWVVEDASARAGAVVGRVGPPAGAVMPLDLASASAR